MSVGNVKNQNKQDLLFTSSIALGGGIVGARAGYLSSPKVDDKFIKETQDNILDKLGGADGKNLKIYRDYEQRILESENWKDLAKIDLDFYSQMSKDKSFENLKRVLKEKFTNSEFFRENISSQCDSLLDDILRLEKSNDKEELLLAWKKIIKKQFKSMDANSIKIIMLDQKSLELGVDDTVDKIKNSVLDAISLKDGKYTIDVKKLPKDILAVIDDKMKIFKNKAAIRCAALGALIAGTVSYVSLKVFGGNLKNTKKDGK